VKGFRGVVGGGRVEDCKEMQNGWKINIISEANDFWSSKNSESSSQI